MLPPVRYADLDTRAVEEEDVYGGFWVKLLHGTSLGRLLSALIAVPPVSRFYGWLQDRLGSRRNVARFIERFGIEMDDFLPEEGRSSDSLFSTLNNFFTRRVTQAAQPFADAPRLPAPCDARDFGYIFPTTVKCWRRGGSPERVTRSTHGRWRSGRTSS